MKIQYSQKKKSINAGTAIIDEEDAFSKRTININYD